MMNMFRFCIMAVLWILFQDCLAGSSDTSMICDPRFTPDTGIYGYRLRGSSNRCEGLYATKVASSPVSIVALLMNPLGHTIADDSVFIISVPPLGHYDIPEVHIMLVPYGLNVFYQMDAVTSHITAYRWPLDIIKAAGDSSLANGQFGIYGWVNLNGNKCLIPVSVHSPDAISKPSFYNTPMIGIRSNVAIASIVMEWFNPDNTSDTLTIANGPSFAGKIVLFPLPPGPPGIVNIMISAQIGNEYYPMTLSVLRPTNVK